MTIKDRNGRITIDTIWPDGRRTRRQAINMKQAKKLDLRIRASRIDGTWRKLRRELNMEPMAAMTLNEAAGLYIEQYVKYRNRDVRSKKSRLAIFERTMGNQQLAAIDKELVHRYVSKRIKEGASAKTINRDLATIRHMFEWARQNDLLEKNPLEDWQKLAEKPFENPKPTEEIIDAVFAELEEVTKPLFEFLRHTGCRREEGLSLKRSQVDIRNQVAVLYNTKSGKPRHVPLSSEAIQAIEAMPRIAQTDYVFYHPVSLTRWREAKGPWIKARKAAGYSWLRIHDLRHAYAIKLVEAGISLDIVSEMLGHHSVDFTKKVYAKYAPSWAGRAVLAALDGGKQKALNGR